MSASILCKLSDNRFMFIFMSGERSGNKFMALQNATQDSQIAIQVQICIAVLHTGTIIYYMRQNVNI